MHANTPIEWYPSIQLWVKREDLCCPDPGPKFSKMRGVISHLEKVAANKIGVLDTYHSQAGHAVAYACSLLGKQCFNFYPEFKADKTLRVPQQRSRDLGATLYPLQAGRSCILYHKARATMEACGGYMMPNALKLEESVIETAKEWPVGREFDQVIIPCSSGTIAAGVVRGACEAVRYGGKLPKFIFHLGYSRSHKDFLDYVQDRSGWTFTPAAFDLIDEGYAYKDQVKDFIWDAWPCNQYYDAKALAWALRTGNVGPNTLFWNIG